ncbi:MAG: DUF2934 domain-containing protein [Verrucomicrobia bacterium]|nr:DUF2934 domain-containing protein [Verrucomicrobiota bacterium]
MPRKKKTAEDQQTNGAGAPNGTATEPQPKAKRAPRRKSASPQAAQSAAEKIATAMPEITDEAIRLRAYFIAEERLRRSLPGDAESDWLEARRQLTVERGA